MAADSNLARYRYISKLGSGGMATVALAEDTLLGRPVALKRMAGAADARGLSRLRREALVGASVSHPNLVSIYDAATFEEGDLVIVMEYVRGETLRDALIRQRKLPVPDALRILESVAAGLDTIHRHGIVHRDVKPSNILLGADGTVKVADLGIASAPDQTRITTAGSVLGSLSYMAPEQLEDAPSTPAIDVYALAAVAFEILSGSKARREPNPVALAHAISTRPPPDLRDAWPAAPRAVAELLIGGMMRDPAERPPSAGELVQRLRAALQPDSSPSIAASRAPALSAATPPVARRAQRRSAPPQAEPVGPVRSAKEHEHAGAGRPPPREEGVGAPARGQPRRGLLAAGLLTLVAVAVVLAVLLNTGGSRREQPRQAAASHRSPAAAIASHTGTAGTAPVSSGSATTPAAPSAAPSPSASTPAASPGLAGSRSPQGAVQSFYGLAAEHRYAEAWALADPAFQNQLGGYQSFQAGQQGDRSISFDSAQTVGQSSSGATVAVKTTSVRSHGTHHCAGTVDLRADTGSGHWLLHQIHISCT